MKYSVDIEELVKMYEGGMTSRQIGEVVNIPFSTVLRYLKKAGAKLRNPGDPHHRILDDAEWLRGKYLDEGLSTTQIAKEIGASARVICTWLERHGIERRPTGAPKGHNYWDSEEAKKNLSRAKRGKCLGEDNPNWRGGMPYHDYDRNRYPAKQWVKAVKDRDNWTCQECGATNNLHAHHIKRWKDYPDLRYDLDNGVTLCHTCHERAHGRGFKFRWTNKQKTPRAHRPS